MDTLKISAAVQMTNTLHVVVVTTEQTGGQQIPGIPPQRLQSNTRLARCIACAVYESLKPNSFLFQAGSLDREEREREREREDVWEGGGLDPTNQLDCWPGYISKETRLLL